MKNERYIRELEGKDPENSFAVSERTKGTDKTNGPYFRTKATIALLMGISVSEFKMAYRYNRVRIAKVFKGHVNEIAESKNDTTKVSKGTVGMGGERILLSTNRFGRFRRSRRRFV